MHCLALPVALIVAPLLAHWLHESETMAHWILLGSALPISALALWRGYRKHHDWLTIALGSIGLLLMLLGVSHLHEWLHETALTVTGVLLLLWSHLRNLTRQHKHA